MAFLPGEGEAMIELIEGENSDKWAFLDSMDQIIWMKKLLISRLMGLIDPWTFAP
jgi:hypothetical protein